MSYSRKIANHCFPGIAHILDKMQKEESSNSGTQFPQHDIYIWYYMSAHVLLNLSNELGKKISTNNSFYLSHDFKFT